MRLPWLKIAMEVLEVSASELAARLDIGEGDAFLALGRLMAWARARCPEDLPPSESDTITGAVAARVVAAGAQYRGDPEAFVEACCTLAYPVLERVEGGIRIKGLDRYDSAWMKNYPAKAAAWKLKTGNRPEPEPKPGEDRAEVEPKPERQKQTQIQKQNLLLKEEEAPTQNVVPLPKKPEDPYASPEAFFAHIQHHRSSHGLVTEKPPRKLSQWWSEVGMELSGDFTRLDATYEHFSDDPYWADAKPPWPFNAFITEWRKHVSRAEKRA